MAPDPQPLSRTALVAGGLACALLGAVAGWQFQAHRQPANRAQIEGVVHDYILAHPEILPEAMEHLRQQEAGKELAAVRGPVEAPFPGAVLGNPNGRLTLVEFTDYACGFCRRSVEDLAALTRANPDLKVVVRELPILSPQSADAAKMALAAAGQGRFAAFHAALFAIGRPDPDAVSQAARSAGVDAGRAKASLADPRVQAEIDRNLDLARQLGFSGTPSWVVGNTMLSGAVGVDELAKAIAAARG